MNNNKGNMVNTIPGIMFFKVIWKIPKIKPEKHSVRLPNQYAKSGPPFCQYARNATPTNKLLIIRVTINDFKKILTFFILIDRALTIRFM
jgi:hypothetical protein